ncbi:major facilitator superfamily domain-containing protein [Cercophora newfieldiana]|uniref:Major facilitator superfamily domain-containing protein n=1 Tax=Cercophora newfieldiana TaxID=92897 RepID=A0AA40CJP6_9PEZI|nr:major facilitator superfamily domain-containing protein [Cercophora newfieldiana]
MFGVQQMKALSEHLTSFGQAGLLSSIFLLACTYTLCNILLNSVYEPIATSSFHNHSFFTAVNILQAAISVAAMTTVAKLADLFGRPKIVIASTVFIPIGTAVQAVASNVVTFAVGAVLYQLGLTCIIMSITIIIADTTSLRSRLFCQLIPSLPALINTWTAGNISSAVLQTTTWRWGIGMWSPIYLATAIPLLCCLWVVSRRASRAHATDASGARNARVRGDVWRFLVSLFWQLDAIGTLQIIAALNLILLPLCLAGGAFKIPWKSPAIITPLILGVLIIPVWILWETRSRQPLVPFKLLKDPAVWAAFLIGMLFDTSHALQASFLYTYLIVATGESVMSATRIAGLYKFVIASVGSLIGVAVYFRPRRLKLIIILGNILFTVGFGVLSYVRGTVSPWSHANIIASQVFLGIGGSMFVYPIQVALQAVCRREYVAIIMSLFFCCNCIGVALGNAIAGTIWNQVLPGQLSATLGSHAEAQSAFADPFAYANSHPIGTAERDAVAASYAYVQRVICLVGVGTSSLQILLSFLIRDPELEKEQGVSSIGSD